MRVIIERERRTESLSFSGSARQLCDRLGINPRTVLILVNDTLVTEDETIADGDTVTLLTVASGG